MNSVSVALCTYNGQRFLPEQLASIAAQSLQPDELVICDDRSNDETVAIIENFARQVPFKVIIEQNRETLGSTRNFEKALGLCTETHIALCDQDDLWYPHKLKTLLNAFQLNPRLGGVFSNGDVADHDLQLTSETLWSAFHFTPAYQRRFRKDPKSVLLITPVVTGATLMVRADLRPRFAHIPPSWVHDAWISWMLALYSRLDLVPEALIRYRAHPSQQIGVPPASILGKLELLRRTAVSDFEKQVEQFEQMYSILRQADDDTLNEFLPCIRQKISHSLMCANLPSGLLPRCLTIIGAWKSYEQYAFGLRSMVRDVLLQLGTQKPRSQ